MDTNVSPTSEVNDDKNKTYHSPQVFVYGNIREITQTVNEMGAMDGGGNPMDKTGQL
jgi:hypothetical protein